MSDVWQGGKGSKVRILSDTKKYSDNFQNINFSSRRKDAIIPPVSKGERYLLLDDIRNPEDCQLHDEGGMLVKLSGISAGAWDVVRDYDSFVAYIDKYGIPDIISFDNDLNMETMAKYCDAVSRCEDINLTTVSEKQGLHCAHYVVKKCIEWKQEIPCYYIHSANMFARPMIRKIMEDGKIRN